MVIGGDSAYLKSAGMIQNNSLPLLGINTDPVRRTGALLNGEIHIHN
jgi:NAD kinase